MPNLNMEKILTVVITTFNRQSRLIIQLKSLFDQPQFEHLQIIISDNCSDYDLEMVLSSIFSKNQMECISIIRRPFNIGMIGNITNAFLLVKTKWMWLLSDDDETSYNSIETIFNFIKLNPNVMGLKFTNINSINVVDHTEVSVSSLPELLLFCKKCKMDLGNFIFMSNNVYNMEVIKPYLRLAFDHSYTYFPHVIPFIFGLNNNRVLKFIPLSIVNYREPEKQPSSDYFVSIYLGAMSIGDLKLNLSKQDFIKFCNFFKMNPFWKISSDVFTSQYSQKLFLYRKIYHSLYKYEWNFKNALIYKLFYFQIYIDNNLISSSLLKTKKNFKKLLNHFY